MEVPEVKRPSDKQPKKKTNESKDAGEEKGSEKKKGIDDLDMCAAISPFKSSQSKVEKMIQEARERKAKKENSE